LGVALGAGSVAGRELRAAELGLALEGSQLALSSSKLDSAFGRVRAEGATDLAGWLAPGAPADVELAAEVEALDLSVLLERPELAGQLTGTVRASAQHVAGRELRAGRAEVELALAPSRFGKLVLQCGDLRGVYDAGRWQLERARLRSSAAQLDASGSGDLEKIEKLDASLDVSNLGALAALANANAAAAQPALRGPWRAPRRSSSTRASCARSVELGSLRLRARPGAGSVPDRPARAASLATDGPSCCAAPARACASSRRGCGAKVESVALRRLVLPGGAVLSSRSTSSASRSPVGTLAGLTTPLGGALHGKLTANGALPSPALAGALTWDAPKLGGVEADRVVVELATRSDVLYAEGRIAARGRDVLTAHAALPWTARRDLAELLRHPETRLEIASPDLPLGLVQDLLPARVQNVQGTGSLRIESRGDPGEPKLDGELVIANASAELPVLQQRFGPLDAHPAGPTWRTTAS
jgi:autotransporter translocation and assembly factor TamB